MFPTNANPPHPAMNAIPTPPPTRQETPAERDARHISVCCMLTDLAAELAQVAAAVALREMAQHPPPPEETPTPQKPVTHAATLFATLACAARQAIALERRIVNAAAQRPATRPTYRAPNPRRPIITRALHQAATDHPQAPALREEMEAQLDRELTETPESPTPDIIRRICNGFGIHIDPDPGPNHPRRHLYAALNTS